MLTVESPIGQAGISFFFGGKNLKKSSVLTTLYRKMPICSWFHLKLGVEANFFWQQMPPLPTPGATTVWIPISQKVILCFFFFTTDAKQYLLKCHAKIISRGVENFGASHYYSIHTLFSQLLENFWNVGSPIGHADFSPPHYKYVYLIKYRCYVGHFFTI